MNKFIKKVNEKENTILTICILIIASCVIFFIVLLAKEKEKRDTFIFKDNLEDQVLTINQDKSNSTTINLREFSYYIIVAEANTQDQALFFREETPVNYWELKTAPLDNVRSLTKDFCLDTCIRDNVLYLEALKHNISLTDEEEKYMKEVSHDIYISLTGEQVDITSIELSDITQVQKKIFLAEKYVLYLLDNGKITEKSDVSSDGTYYKEEIKPYYKVDKNNNLIDELVFGSITVNVVKE